MEHIKDLLIEEDIDILCITETWLKPSIDDMYVNIENYSIFRSDRRDEKRGGGCCIYVKSCYQAMEINKNAQINNEDQQGIEDIWIKVQVKKMESIIVGALYKNKTNIGHAYTEKALQYFSTMKKKMYLFGDLNENQIEEANGKKINSKLKSILKRLNLHQIIDEPTRITESTKTIIDLIITNDKNSVLSKEVKPSIADHLKTQCTINLLKTRLKPRKIIFRQQKNYSAEAFQQELINSEYQFKLIIRTDNVDKQVEIFSRTFTEALDKCAPITTITSKRRPAKWMTDDIKTEVAHKKHLCNLFKTSVEGKVKIQRQYKVQNRKVSKMVSDAKIKHYHKELHKTRKNPKETWNIVK